MDVLVTIQHPAHVHFFRNAVEELTERGHDTHVFALDKDVTQSLLDASNMEYTVLARRSPGDSVLRTHLTYEYRLWRAARKIEPDVVTGIGGVSASHVATLVGARSVIFTDTENATLSNRLAFPFADSICTPTCYDEQVGPKQHTYPGFHELAYLHPNRFTPDRGALADLDVEPEDTFVVFRLVSWEAMHDMGSTGFANSNDGFHRLETAIERLEATNTTVLLTAEASLPSALEEYRTDIPPHRMHDLLSYADVFVGESGTMTAESAVLGTPAIHIHQETFGLMDELAAYGLAFPFNGPDRHDAGIEKATDILDGSDSSDWKARREQLLGDHRDTTDIVVERLLRSKQR